MASVTIYTRTLCIWCIRAKYLLRRHGVAYTELPAASPETRDMLVARTGRRTVPQIFFGDEAIGGFDDLRALVDRGELPARLGVR